MPRETEADRILQERLRQKEAQERRKQAEAANQTQITYLRYLDEIHVEINTVLRLLAELNYPFMQEVRFRKEHNFILFELFDHNVTKAGWGIGSYTYEMRGDPMSKPIYLLSDGCLCCDNSVGSPEKIIGSYGRSGSYDSTGCLKGLQDLRRKLEEKKRPAKQETKAQTPKTSICPHCLREQTNTRFCEWCQRDLTEKPRQTL